MSPSKPFNITIIQVYALTGNAEEAEVEQFYEDLQDLLELTPSKDVLFIIEDRNAKVGEDNGNPLQYSCLENPMDRGTWWAAVHGVAKSQTRLSDVTFTHWRRKWQPTPVFLPGESQGRRDLVGCRLWGHTESDTTGET